MAQFSIKILIVEPGSFRTEGIMSEPVYEGNPIPDYDEYRKKVKQMYESIPGTQPGDPEKAMEILVDVVRGEGVAEGKSLPLYLPLGPDAEEAIRGKTIVMNEVLEEWKDVIRSTDLGKEGQAK